VSAVQCACVYLDYAATIASFILRFCSPDLSLCFAGLLRDARANERENN